MIRLFALVMATFFALVPGITLAGSSEGGTVVYPSNQVATFANRVQKDLASRGVHVAIVSRMGRDPNILPDGVTYTHVSFWVYSNITNSDGTSGRGYQVFNLYQKAGNLTRSHLVQDSPAAFFSTAQRLDAGVIIPDIRLQKKLIKVITSPTYAKLHNAKYSVLANPNTNQFQNCTEHTLNVLMASLYGTSNVAQVKANISAHFKPQQIQLGGMKRILAPVSTPALTTSDHGATVSTATFSSISRFMKANDLATSVYHMTPEKIYKF